MKYKVCTLVTAAALVLVGCSNTPQADDAETSETGETTLTVLAAASLQKSFDEIAEEFTAEHPTIEIDFN